jgi:hypothetical protein
MPYWKIFKQCFPQSFNVFFTYFVTMAIFPGVYSGKKLRQHSPTIIIQQPVAYG